MSQILNFLEQNGGMLLTGATAALGLGVLLCCLQKSPAKRQRICEFTVLFSLLWLFLACVPMSRLSLSTHASNSGADDPVGEARAAGVLTGERPQADEIPLIGKSLPAHEILADSNDAPPNQPLPAPKDTLAPIPISPNTSSPLKTSWNQRLSLAVLVGSGFMGLRILLGQLVLMGLFLRSKRNQQLAELAAREGAAGVDVRVSSRLTRPISFGLFRSKIILPADYLHESPRVRQVLLHEIAHIRRKDAWGNLLMNIAGVALWFHPAYWFLNAQARLARELLADDWAAAKGDKQSYAMELIAIARMRVGSGIAGGVALGILGSRSEFFRRMHMLISRKHSLETGCSKVWRLGMLALGLSVATGLVATLGVKPAAAAETQPPAKPAIDPRQEVRIKRNTMVSIPEGGVLLGANNVPPAAPDAVIDLPGKPELNVFRIINLKPGETLKSIGQSLYKDEKSVNEFLEANKDFNPDLLKPAGQALLSMYDKTIVKLVHVEQDSLEMQKLVDSYAKLGADFMAQEMKLLAEKHLAMQQAADEAQLTLDRTLKRIRAGQEDSKIAEMLDSNPTLQKLQDQIAQFQKELRDLGPNHPNLKAAEAQIEQSRIQFEEQRRKLEDRMKNQLENSLQEKAEAARQNLQAMEDRIKAMQKAMNRLKPEPKTPLNPVPEINNRSGDAIPGLKLMGIASEGGKSFAVFSVGDPGIVKTYSVGDSIETPNGTVTILTIDQNKTKIQFGDRQIVLAFEPPSRNLIPSNILPTPVEPANKATRANSDKPADLSMDLVSLANTAMEAKGAVNLAKVKLSQATTQDEKKLAEVTLDNANQRAALLKNLLQISLASAEQDAERAQSLHDAALISNQEFEAAMSRLNLIKTIYGSME